MSLLVSAAPDPAAAAAAAAAARGKVKPATASAAASAAAAHLLSFPPLSLSPSVGGTCSAAELLIGLG